MPVKPKTSKFLTLFPQEVKQLALELTYDGAEELSEPERLEVAAATRDIWDSQKQITSRIFEIGRRVYRVQQILKKEDSFVSWLNTAFPRSPGQAYGYLNVFLRWREKEQEFLDLAEELSQETIIELAKADRKVLQAAQDYPEIMEQVPLASAQAQALLQTGQSVTQYVARDLGKQTRQATRESLQERQRWLNRDTLISIGIEPEVANKLKTTPVANNQWEKNAILSLSTADRHRAADLILSGECKNARDAKRLILEEHERNSQPIDVAAEIEQEQERQAVHQKIAGANWLDWWKEQAEDSTDLIWCNAPMAQDKVQDFHLYAEQAKRTLKDGGCLLVILPDDSLDEAIAILKSHGLKWGRPIALHLGQGSSQSVGKYCVDDVRLLGPFFKGSRKHTAWNNEGKPYPAFYNRSFGSFEAAADNLIKRLTNPWDTSWVLGADATIWEKFCLEDRHCYGVGLKS